MQSLQVEKTTYTIIDFLEWQRQGTLDLQPFYQRRSVWNPRVKSLLIDSLLRGYPLPLVFLHNRLDVTTSKSLRQVVDGQQRLRTILAYIDLDCLQHTDEWDHFQVLPSHNKDYAGLAFSKLPDDVQGRILQTPLSVNVLPADIDDVTVLTIFQRMNSTGFKLNDQEIRNATFFGEFKESAYALAYAQNQRYQSWGIFDRQAVAQMKEVETTSDLMGFLASGISARSKAILNRLYRANDVEFAKRQDVESDFEATFDRLEGVYGPDATRTNLKRFKTSAWFFAVFAVASGRFGDFEPEQILEALEQTEVAIRAGGLEEDLHKVLRGATADRKSRETRVNYLLELMS